MMNCPRCNGGLKGERLKGIEVDRCQSCHGIWLDHPELDQLEDKVLDEDEVKGTMILRPRQGDLACPKCQQPMHAFNYRAYDMELDFCEQEHGFWLDDGEEQRVLELMKRRIKDLGRASKAEAQWADLLQSFKSKTLGKRIKGLFRR